MAVFLSRVSGSLHECHGMTLLGACRKRKPCHAQFHIEGRASVFMHVFTSLGEEAYKAVAADISIMNLSSDGDNSCIMRSAVCKRGIVRDCIVL